MTNIERGGGKTNISILESSRKPTLERVLYGNGFVRDLVQVKARKEVIARWNAKETLNRPDPTDPPTPPPAA